MAAVQEIRDELRERLDVLNGKGNFFEAQVLELLTAYDIGDVGEGWVLQ